jgi:hypothetical protein
MEVPRSLGYLCVTKWALATRELCLGDAEIAEVVAAVGDHGRDENLDTYRSG